ncbi:MAG: protein kinase [Planctomycetes bacterium]|nr:protein kinase [Planctomycetota bacterium]
MQDRHSPEERHALLTRLFVEASELAGAERAAFLERACAGDAPLRAELDELFQGAGQRVSLLDETDTQARAGGLLGLLADAEERWIGSEIGGCRIVEFIGAGGMGAVFRARQSQPPRDVALKLVRSASFGESALRRFEVETQLLAHLQHPGIAKVHSAGVHVQGPLRVPYCVLELIEGGRSITSYARQQRLDVRASVQLFLQACDALQHAHEHRVIHRDVKPENLLVDAAGRVRVIDFGIARALTGEGLASSRTRTGQLLGTPAYMSPEQLGARHDELDTRADVYSLGVVLFELLAGRLPIEVEGLSFVELSRRILEEEPLRLSTLRKSLRGDLETIVEKALSKDPLRRYGSAGALAADLRRFLFDEPIAARPATAMYQLSKFARRHRGLVGGAVVGLAAMVVAAAFAVSSAWRALDARDAARQSAYDANLGAAASAIAHFEFNAARRRLDAAPPELRGWEWDYFDARLDDASLTIPLGSAQLSSSGVRDLEFVPDARGDEALVAALSQAGADGDLGIVRRFDPESGALLAQFEHGPLPEQWSAIAAERVWHTAQGGRIEQQSLDDGRTLASHSFEALRAYAGRYQIAAFDEARCVVTRRLGSASFVIDLARGTCDSLAELPERPSELALRAMTRAGDAVVSFGTQVCVAPMRSGEPRLCIERPGEPILAFAIHPDGERYFAASQDGGLLVFRCARGVLELERRVEAHTDAVLCVEISRDGQFVATGGKDRAVRVWRADTCELVTTLAGADAAVTQLAFSSDARKLAASGGERGLLVFDEPTITDPRVLRGANGYVYALALAPDERLVASGDWGGDLCLWDRESGALVARRALGARSARFSCLAWSPDGRRIAAALCNSIEGHAIALLELASPDPPRRTALVKGRPPLAIEWIDEQSVVVATPEALELRRGSDGTLVRDLELRNTAPLSATWSLRWQIALAPDRRTFAAALPTGAIGLWSAPDGTWLRTFEAHNGPAHAVAWSSDGARLATAGADGLVCVFDPRDGRRLAELRGHASAVFSVSWSPDGARLYSGSDDDTLRVWDARTGHELAPLVGHADYVFNVVCASDGRLVSSSGDRTLRLWDHRPRAEVLRAVQARRDGTAQLEPLVARWCADGDLLAAFERARSDATLAPRERELAAQLVVERAARPR